MPRNECVVFMRLKTWKTQFDLLRIGFTTTHKSCTFFLFQPQFPARTSSAPPSLEEQNRHRQHLEHLAAHQPQIPSKVLILKPKLETTECNLSKVTMIWRAVKHIPSILSIQRMVLRLSTSQLGFFRQETIFMQGHRRLTLVACSVLMSLLSVSNRGAKELARYLGGLLRFTTMLG
jgi:hypothetical protein